MLRVLMVLEDYGELMFLQTVLKKIGFDVDAIQNPRSFSDSLLTMNPDLLVMTAHGKKVKGAELAKTVRKMLGVPRIILIRSAGSPTSADPTVDGWLDSPVGAMNLLNLIGEVSGLNKDVLADKFQKLQLQEVGDPDSVMFLQGQIPDAQHLEKSKKPVGNFSVEEAEAEAAAAADTSAEARTEVANEVAIEACTVSSAERQERYKKFLENKPEHIGFGTKQVQAQVKALRQAENTVDLADLEQERKAFVEHLFNKKKD